MELKEFIRNIPDFPKKGIQYKDITTLLKQPDAYKRAIDVFVDHFRSHQVDHFVGIESRGFLFAAPLAYALNKGLVLIRKKGKLPGHTISYEYQLEYGTDTLEIHSDSIEPGQRVVIMDDLLATGGTALAAKKLLNTSGANITGFGFLVELEFLEGAKDLGEDLIFSQIKYND